MLRFYSFAAAAMCLCAPFAFSEALANEAIDNIIVTASPINRSGDDLTTAITTVNRDEILSEAATSLGDLLGNKPGITQSSFAAGASRPIIRGLDNFRIRIQENGVASNGASPLSEDHGAPIDPLAAQRVEVVRGPATLRYGSQAIGGVVNVINNRVPRAFPDHLINGEGIISLNSANDGQEASILLDGQAGGNIAWHADSFFRKTEDYDIPTDTGSMENTSTEAKGVAIGSSLILDQGHAGISFSRFESTYGIPAAEVPLFIKMDQTRVTLDLDLDLQLPAVKTLRLESGISDYHHDEIHEATGIIGSTFETDEAEARLEILHEPFRGLTGAIGLQWSTRNLLASGEGGELIAPSSTTAAAIFVFEEWQWSDHVTFQAAARAETHEVEGRGLATFAVADSERSWSRTFTPLAASFGVTFDFDDRYSMGITSQIVERAPDALELFAKGPHEATETLELGNPRLSKETALSSEITLKRSEGRVTWQGTGYYTQFKDFIFKSFTGVSCGEDLASCGIEQDLTQIVYAQDSARFFGFELEGEWNAGEFFGGPLTLSGWADYVNATLETGGNVPRIPPVRIGLGARYDRDPWYASIKMTQTLEQNRLGQFETKTGGHTNLAADFGIRTALGPGKRKVTLKLTGHNLLNEDIRNHVSFKKEEVPLPGRAIRLVLIGKF